MKHLQNCMESILADRTAENLAVKVGRGTTVLFEGYASEKGIDEYTLFDMASVTKILSTANLTFLAFERGLLSPETKVSAFYPCPPEKENLTVFHLLTHQLGIGYQILYREENNYENIAEKILDIPCGIPVGTDVIYSCPAFILLGKILERVYGESLDVLFRERVAEPLGLKSTVFCPRNRDNIVNSNIKEENLGKVNDYNSRYLGGITGNAGLFSNMRDMTNYAISLCGGLSELILPDTFAKAARNYTAHMSESRGLGFLYVDKRYPQTGTLFPEGSIGHCGHTGQSVFADPKSGLYVIILSDATISITKKYGAEHYDEVMRMRADLHNAIRADLYPDG